MHLNLGETLLLVSDGVTAELSDGKIADYIDAADLVGSACRLFNAVMAAGDDFSVILIVPELLAT